MKALHGIAIVSGILIPQQRLPAQSRDSVRHLWGRSGNSGFRSALRAVVRDSATFHKLWTQAVGPSAQAPATPQIDFGREMIIVAAMGEQFSGGNDFGIDSVRADRFTLDVYDHLTSPGDYCGVTANIEWPADIVAVPQGWGTVVFHETRIRRKCSTPFTRSKSK